MLQCAQSRDGCSRSVRIRVRRSRRAHNTIAGIMYGMPVFDAELRRKLDEGKVALGGCEIEFDHPMPSHHCNDCGKEF